MVDAESLMALKDLMNRLGCETLCTEEIFPEVCANFLLVWSKNQCCVNIDPALLTVICRYQILLIPYFTDTSCADNSCSDTVPFVEEPQVSDVFEKNTTLPTVNSVVRLQIYLYP